VTKREGADKLIHRMMIVQGLENVTIDDNKPISNCGVRNNDTIVVFIQALGGHSPHPPHHYRLPLYYYY